MSMIIDEQKLHTLMVRPFRPASPVELRRDGSVFFVGGDLPVNVTLETMFESFCMASTSLFHLSFGAGTGFIRGEKMARQIKRNFPVRLMGRLETIPAPHDMERAYAAGIDLLDIPGPQSDGALAGEGSKARKEFRAALNAAGQLFPRWSVASTLVVGEGAFAAMAADIDALLADGVVPLVTLSDRAVYQPCAAVAGLFAHLAAGWQRHQATVKPFLPLIDLMTPLVPGKTAGRLRGLVDRIRDRQHLAAADLRRHLRVASASDSLDSAGL